MINRLFSTFSVKGGEQSGESQDGRGAKSKSVKEKTSKAERRALQEAQRAAKAAAKGESSPFISFSASFAFIHFNSR